MHSPQYILLVGAEEGLRKDLRALASAPASDWHFVLARGFLEAMALLAGHPCEAVVAELALPGFSGAQLLMEVLHRHPRTRRFLLAESRRLPASPKCSGAAHQVWLKPLTAEALIERLARALAHETWFPGEPAQRLFARLPSMPAAPEIFFQVEEARQHGTLSATQAEAIIAGFPEAHRHFSRWAGEAGWNATETTSLVLLAHLRAFFDYAVPRAHSLDSWEAEARMTARLAREIARAETEDEAIIRDAHLGGLLHDVGGLLLDINHPERAAAARRWASQKSIPLWQAEQKMLGATHADFGACLLSQWGLPWPAIEAVARHHDAAPEGRDPFSATTAVRSAVKLVEEWRAASPLDHPVETGAGRTTLAPSASRSDTDFLLQPRAA